MQEEQKLDAPSGIDSESEAEKQEREELVVRVSLFGSFHVEWLTPSQDPLAWISRTSARSLFKLLLFAPGRQASKSQLAGLLWPESPEGKARESLRSASKALARVLTTITGEKILDTSQRETLQLADQSRLWVDIDAFEMFISSVDDRTDRQQAIICWQQAKHLLRGELLADDRLQQWVTCHWIKKRKQALWMARCRMVRSLSDMYVQMGQTAAAEEVLETHLVQFPTDQDALFRLLVLLVQQGCSDEALQLYERSKRLLLARGKKTAQHIDRFMADISTKATHAILKQSHERIAVREGGKTRSLAQSVSEVTPTLLSLALPQQPEPSHNYKQELFSDILSQEGAFQTMDASRRQLLAGLLALAGTSAIPQEWWDHLIHQKTSSLTEEEYGYFQQLVEDGWGLCNAGEWGLAEQMLSGFLPETIQKAAKSKDAARLAAQGLVLRSILQAHQLNIAAMIPLCRQATTYAKFSGDVTIICAALNGLAVAYKYNQRTEHSFQTYLEALDACPEAAPLIRSRIYAGAAAAFAKRGRKQETEKHIAMAYECFPTNPDHDPHFLSADHGIYMLAYYQGIAFLEFQEPQRALQAFDSFHSKAPVNAVPKRNQLEILNHKGRASIGAKNLEWYVQCLDEGLKGAQALKSQKRQDEAMTIFQQDVPAAWHREKSLRDVVEQYPFLQVAR